MDCFHRVKMTVRSFWMHVSARLGLHRKTGLRKLRKEVNACEYEDVQVMWEMLNESEKRSSARSLVEKPRKQRRGLPLMHWATAPCRFCHAFWICSHHTIFSR